MLSDHYAGSARRWATGAALVYAPIAEELVALCSDPLDAVRVLDAGAGTGVASAALVRRGAAPVAVDLSRDMLAWDRTARPPAAVADLCALPLTSGAVDGAVAAFVLNHLVDPRPAFAELIRVTRPGGFLLACVYSTASASEARDRVDEAARRAGWEVPAWYLNFKTSSVPVLGSADAMATAAVEVGLGGVVVDERPVDVGIADPEQLVDYRLGQAHFASWLDSIGRDRAEEVRSQAIEAARPVMRPYRPIVVFLAARCRAVR